MKKSVEICGRPTSVYLDPAFDEALKVYAASQKKTVDGLLSEWRKEIVGARFSSAVRAKLLSLARSGLIPNDTV